MSKFVLIVDQGLALKDGASITISSARLVGYGGEQVLLARKDGSLFLSYVATGVLKEIAGTTFEILEVHTLPVEVQSSRAETADLFEIPDYEFDDAIARGAGSFVGEIAQPSLIGHHHFSHELEALYRRRCSFSDVQTYRGVATIIQPSEYGGRWQIDNFLFLDPEPAALFSSLAWSIGSRFEIVVDAYATGPDFLSTINRSGMLALPDLVRSWPSRKALAWHFDRFTQRLRKPSP